MAALEREKIRSYSRLEIEAKQLVEGFITGLHKSPFHGFSVEFAEHRQYNPGESTRHIDWKLFGRTDKMFVKQFEEETNLRCRLLIDVSSSMNFPLIKNPNLEDLNKMSFSVYASAAIIEMLKKQRDAFGLSLFSEEIEIHTQAKSNFQHQQLIYSEMSKLLDKSYESRNKKTLATDNLHYIAENTHKRSLIIIFSDMFDNNEKEEDIFDALQHLKYNKHEVILFHVIDKQKEMELDYKNRPYRFVDLESGDELKINPKEIKKEYQKAVNERIKNLKLKCAQYKIDFVDADINKGFNPILQTYFLKRKKMM